MRRNSSFRRRRSPRARSYPSLIHNLFRFTLMAMALIGVAYFWGAIYRWGVRTWTGNLARESQYIEKVSHSHSIKEELAQVRQQLDTIMRLVEAHKSTTLQGDAR